MHVFYVATVYNVAATISTTITRTNHRWNGLKCYR